MRLYGSLTDIHQLSYLRYRNVTEVIENGCLAPSWWKFGESLLNVHTRRFGRCERRAHICLRKGRHSPVVGRLTTT
jgi:hypothetical protein